MTLLPDLRLLIWEGSYDGETSRVRIIGSDDANNPYKYNTWGSPIPQGWSATT